MKLSNSKIKTWRRCPRKFRFKYVEKLEPRAKAVPLERGTWLHELLQYYYDGEDWVTRHKELTKRFYGYFEEEREELGDLPGECLRIMRSYLNYYKAQDSKLRIVDSELDEILELPNGLKFNFIIDLVVEEKGGLWLWDHKTVKTFMPTDFMLLDAQLTRYFWCAEKMGYTPLRGVIFNEIRTKPPTLPALLKSGRLTERRNLDSDYYTYYREIRRHDLDPADYTDTLQRLAARQDGFFRRTRLPKDPPVTRQLMTEMVWAAKEMARASKTDEYPRTPEKACQWDCEFKDLCITELHGGDYEPQVRMNFKRRKRG